jgi:hypothetical protein
MDNRKPLRSIIENAYVTNHPSTEPFYFPGNEIGCLLIHGFTGTPKEMRWMGEYLARQGYSVLGVRLAGHATSRRFAPYILATGSLQSKTAGTCSADPPVASSCVACPWRHASLYFAAQRTVAGIVAMSTPTKCRTVFRTSTI